MAVNIRKIRDLKLFLHQELNAYYPKEEIDAFAKVIVNSCLHLSTISFLAFPETPVSEDDAARIATICDALKEGQPLQYILGHTEFFGCLIKVTPKTLIPRTETEELVDIIIRENDGFRGKIIDIGTGSGCIAIALAKNLTKALVTATDIDRGAIDIAQENAIANNVNITFVNDDIVNTNVIDSFDIIVSNPPYILEKERCLMSRNVLDYEPRLALFVPDNDPLLYYKAILAFASTRLKPEGKIYFEINETMGLAVNELLEGSGYHNVERVRDINGKERITKGVKNG